jgi:NADPH-dependent curcumin reductase CurA
MSPARGYTKGVALGEVMAGGGVGEVVASNHPRWKVGDIAESMSFGWQEWSVLTPDIFGPAGVNKIDAKLAPIESSLSWLGMPGITAYFGLLDVGRPRPSDTVVVSAASGAVGQLVGQIRQTRGMPRGGSRRRRRQAAMVPRDRLRRDHQLQKSR